MQTFFYSECGLFIKIFLRIDKYSKISPGRGVQRPWWQVVLKFYPAQHAASFCWCKIKNKVSLSHYDKLINFRDRRTF